MSVASLELRSTPRRGSRRSTGGARRAPPARGPARGGFFSRRAAGRNFAAWAATRLAEEDLHDVERREVDRAGDERLLLGRVGARRADELGERLGHGLGRGRTLLGRGEAQDEPGVALVDLVDRVAAEEVGLLGGGAEVVDDLRGAAPAPGERAEELG
jgi:hypothetical protein